MRTREYSTDELLLIANNVTGEYTDKQVRQAKMELYKRGVDDKVIADIMEEKEEAFMRRLDAAARAEKARMDKQNEKNRNVSYRWWELIPMLLFAPFYLVRGVKWNLWIYCCSSGLSTQLDTCRFQRSVSPN